MNRSPLKGAENGKYDYSFTCGGSTCGPSVSTAVSQLLPLLSLHAFPCMPSHVDS